MSRSTAYVPTLGDHWMRTEWSTVRHHLPTVHGTKREAIKSLHDRVKFLTGRGWRVVRQKMMDDSTPGERRMMVGIVPPAEYKHCGDSVIEYRSCGGPTFCKSCELAHARVHGIEADAMPAIERAEMVIDQAESGIVERYSMIDDDPDRAKCVADFERGICRQCGRGLRDHMPRYAREAVISFWRE